MEPETNGNGIPAKTVQVLLLLVCLPAVQPVPFNSGRVSRGSPFREMARVTRCVHACLMQGDQTSADYYFDSYSHFGEALRLGVFTSAEMAPPGTAA